MASDLLTFEVLTVGCLRCIIDAKMNSEREGLLLL